MRSSAATLPGSARGPVPAAAPLAPGGRTARWAAPQRPPRRARPPRAAGKTLPSPDLQVSASPGALSAAARAPPSRTRETEAGRPRASSALRAAARSCGPPSAPPSPGQSPGPARGGGRAAPARSALPRGREAPPRRPAASPRGEPAPQQPGRPAGPAPNPHDVTAGRPRPRPWAAGRMTSPRPHPSEASSVLAFISFLSSFRTFLASLAPRLAAGAEPSLCSRRRGPAARRGRPPSTLQTRFHPAGQSARRGPGPGRPRPGTGHAVKPPRPVHLCPEPRAADQCARPAPGQRRCRAEAGWSGPGTGSRGGGRAPSCGREKRRRSLPRTHPAPRRLRS